MWLITNQSINQPVLAWAVVECLILRNWSIFLLISQLIDWSMLVSVWRQMICQDKFVIWPVNQSTNQSTHQCVVNIFFTIFSSLKGDESIDQSIHPPINRLCIFSAHSFILRNAMYQWSTSYLSCIGWLVDVPTVYGQGVWVFRCDQSIHWFITNLFWTCDQLLDNPSINRPSIIHVFQL